jgi:hypothetical protein
MMGLSETQNETLKMKTCYGYEKAGINPGGVL